MILSPGEAGIELACDCMRSLAKDTTADYVSAVAASGTAEHAVLKKCGFLRINRLGPVLTVKTVELSPEIPNPFQWSNWRSSLGDLELF